MQNTKKNQRYMDILCNILQWNKQSNSRGKQLKCITVQINTLDSGTKSSTFPPLSFPFSSIYCSFSLPVSLYYPLLQSSRVLPPQLPSTWVMELYHLARKDHAKCFYHVIDMQPWAKYLNTLCLNFPDSEVLKTTGSISEEQKEGQMR